MWTAIIAPQLAPQLAPQKLITKFMKNLLSAKFIFALIGIIGIVVGLNISKVAFAQSVDGNVGMQIGRLVETLEKLLVVEQGDIENPNEIDRSRLKTN